MSLRPLRRLGAIGALLLIAGAAPAQDTGREPTDAPRVEVTTSKDVVTVGEAFTVDLTAHGPAGAEWTFPTEIVEDEAELRAVTTQEPLPPGTQRYEAMVFAVDETRLPAIEVGYRLRDGSEGSVSTEALTLKVASLLPRDAEEQKLADVRPPVGLDISPVFWGTTLLLWVLLGLLAWWLWLRRRQRDEPAAPSVPPISPDVEAREALERLAERRLPASGELRAYYIELVLIAKRYLERRLGAPVVEMTTTEACAFLRDHPEGRHLLSPFRAIVAAGDQVKFARGSAAREEAERHLTETRRLIDALEQRLRPVPEPGAAA